jgi:hypothetical protein
MKTSEFKSLIQSVVQEELKKSLPLMIPQILTEILSHNSKSQVLDEHRQIQPVAVVKKQPVTIKPVENRPIKKYTNNNLLNQVLNETVGGVPREGSYVSLASPMSSGVVSQQFINNQPDVNSVEQLNESVIVPPTHVPVNEEQTKVLAVMNRNFSSFMKVVDKKKNQGGLNRGLIQTD